MLQFANKAYAYLNTSIAAGDTSIVLQSGGGVNFPALVLGLVMTLKIEEPSTGAYEIVYASALSGDTLTIARGQEGSTPQAFQPTAIVSLVATKRVFEALMRKRNRIINGCFRLWDPGTSFATPADNTLLANNWKTHIAGTAGTYTISRVASTPGDWERDNAPKYYLRWNQTVAGTAATLELEQRVEDVHQMAGDNATVSFVAFAASGTPTIQVYVEQIFGTGGSPSAKVTQASVSKVLSTGVAEYECTFALPSIAGKTLGSNGDDYVRVAIAFPGSSTFDIKISNIQLSKTSGAPDFEYRSEGEERKLAARYYYKTFDNDTAPAQSAGTNGALTYAVAVAGTTQGGVGVRFPVVMRTAPTVTLFNPSAANTKWRNVTGAADSGASSSVNAGQRGVFIANVQAAGDVAGNIAAIHMTADANL